MYTEKNRLLMKRQLGGEAEVAKGGGGGGAEETNPTLLLHIHIE